MRGRSGKKFWTLLVSAALLCTSAMPAGADSAAWTAEAAETVTEQTDPAGAAAAVPDEADEDKNNISQTADPSSGPDGTDPMSPQPADPGTTSVPEGETGSVSSEPEGETGSVSSVPEGETGSISSVPTESALTDSSAEPVAGDGILTATVGSLTVTALVPEGALPEGSTLVVRPLPTPDLNDEANRGTEETDDPAEETPEESEVRSAVDGIQTMLSRTRQECADVVLYDIHFEDPENQEIEPGQEVQITFSYADGLSLTGLGGQTDSIQTVHVTDDGQVSAVAARTVLKDDDSIGQVTFSADAFSIYGFLTAKAQTASVTIKKVWNDSRDHSGDSVTVHLLQNGADTGTAVTLNQSSGWTETVTDLAAYDSQGEAITYSAEEEPLNGYTVSYSSSTIDEEGSGQSVYVWVPADSFEDDTEYIIVTSDQSEADVPGFTAKTNGITWTIGKGAKAGDANLIHVTGGTVTTADGRSYDRYITDEEANTQAGISMRWITNYLFTATAHQVEGPYDWYSLQSKLTGWYAKDTGQGDWAQSVETKRDTNATAWHYGLSASAKRQPKNKEDDEHIMFSENDYWPKQNNHTGGDDYAQPFYLYKRAEVRMKSTTRRTILTVTNTPVPDVKLTTELTVLKVDGDDLTRRLSGASFALFRAVVPEGEEENRALWSEGDKIGETVSGTDGSVTFEDLSEGRYILRELSAPEGYLLPEDPRLYVQVSAEGDGLAVKVLRKDGTEPDSLHDGDEIRFAVRNSRPSYSTLPNTGGSGTEWFSISGLMALLLSVLLFFIEIRRRRI